MSRTPLRRPASARCRGFSMVEVLVALLVLSIGLLGIAGLQLTSVRANQSAYLRGQAVMLAQQALDRVRSNVGNADDYEIQLSGSAPASPTTQADRDLQSWLQDLARALPSGDGAIEVTPVNAAAPADGSEVSVTVTWDNNRDGDTSDAEERVLIISRV